MLTLFSTGAGPNEVPQNQDADGQSRTWSGWGDLGGVITAGPAVASWSAGRLDIFVEGTDNHVWHKAWY